MTSSSYYLQSNGLAERAVRSAKDLLEKCKKDGKDINLALLNQRNTSRDKNLDSPAKRLMSRRLKSTIPYKMNVILNKECILIIHKFELNCTFRIKSDSSSAELARYGVVFTSAINLK